MARRPEPKLYDFDLAPGGSTLQALASTLGKGTNWQAIAEANGIENPRILQPGQLIDINIRLPRSLR